MNRNLVGFGMRYGANKGKNTKLGEGMTGKGELWHTKEERTRRLEQELDGECLQGYG